MNLKHNQNIFFNREQIRGDLRNKSVRGASSRALGNGSAAVLTMGSTIVLARLLLPADFGLFTMVVAFTELARTFMEFGLGVVTVQREEITHEEVSALFWINLGIGVLLMVGVACISPVVSWFYGENKLMYVCMALSTTFLFGGLTVQHRSLIERQMHYGHLAVINFISISAGIFVAIIMAMRGFGVWALVWRELISSSSYAIGTWLCCRWLPSPPKPGVNVRSFLRFGADLSGFNIFRYLTQNLDRMLIGRFYGAAPLGFYGKAFQLAMMPVEQIRGTIMAVGLPSLSALQGDLDRYRRFYSKMVSVLSFIYMPMVVFIVVHSENVVLLLLGERWVDATQFLRIFAIVGFITPIMNSPLLVMVSLGKTRSLLKWGIINCVFMILSFTIGIWWGAIGVAYAYLIGTYSLMIPLLLYGFKDTPIGIRLLLDSIALPAISSITVGVIMVLLFPVIPSKNIILNILIFFLVALIAYLGIWFSVTKGRQQMFEYISYSGELFRRA